MLSRPTLLSRRLRRLLTPAVQRAASVPGADRYRKHFPAAAHLWILLSHGVSASPSLRQTHAQLDLVEHGWAQVGLDQRVSLSQLARSTTSRPSACLEHLFTDLADQVPLGDHPVTETPVLLRDGTFLELSGKLSPWCRYGQHTPGIRLQLDYDLVATIPTALHLTLADTHDARTLAEQDLHPLAGWTLIIDLGYYGHRQFQRLRDHDVEFLCPLHQQARVEATTQHAVNDTPTEAGDTIVADETITLGSPNNRNGAVLPNLRLVTSQNATGETHHLVTSRHDLSAQDVVMLYRQRWQIELFFRWLKRHLGMLHPLGTSPEAVWATILLAAIVAILAVLLDDLRPASVSAIAWLRVVAIELARIPASSPGCDEASRTNL